MSRVEELDSDDDSDTQGVGLHSSEKRYISSDSLQFAGMDLTTQGSSRRKFSYSSASSDASSDDDDDEFQSPLQMAMRDKEEELVQRALTRIRRARERGKVEVKLDREELEALERRQRRLQSAAKKGAGSSGSGSERKRRERHAVPIAPLLEEETGRKSRSRRSTDALPSHPASITPGPPGMLVQGPDGQTYAALGYYTPARGSPARSRSSTMQSRGTPPPQFAFQNRHLVDGIPRPTSSSSNGSHRPLPDEESWIPAHSRRSSVSSQSHSLDPFEYQTSAHPPAVPQRYIPSPSASRRNLATLASTPEVAYGNIRRNPPVAVAAAYSSPSPRGRSSTPTIPRRSGRHAEVIKGRGINGSSSEDEDTSDDLGNGVQVFVEPERPPAVAATAPAPAPPTPAKKSSGGGKKKNKGKRS